MRRIFSFITLFLALSISAFAQPQPSFEYAGQLITDLRFDEANAVLDQLEEDNEPQWKLAYLHLSLSFIKNMIDANEKAYDEVRDQMENWLDIVEDDGDKSDPDYYLFVGEMNLQLAAIEAKFGNNWSAGQYGLSGLNALKRGRREHPAYVPMYAGIGVLNVAIGSIPETYQGFVNLLGFSGEVETGMSYLRMALNASNREQWKYLKGKHAFIYGYISNQLQPGKLKSMRELGVDPTTSPAIAFIEAKMLQSQGKNDELIALLDTIRRLPNRYPVPYLYYLYGRAKLARGDDDANVYLEQYLRDCQGKNYIKSTLRYLSWYYRLHGNSAKAEEYRKRVLGEEGDDFVGGDKEAIQEMELPPMPLALLKARLAFDAGHFVEGLALLPTTDASLYTGINLIEYHYRRARIFQSLNQNAMAAKDFKAAVEIEAEPTTYARANSELQLGVILEEVNPRAAIQYYEGVLDLDDYPWYEGTQQKAKAGLERLNQ